ncbi:response regulator [Candidatus Nitrospira bockiana]
MAFADRPFLAPLLERWRASVRLRHTVSVSVIVLLIMGLGSAVMLHQHGATIRKAAEARGLAFSRTFALMGAAAVIDNLFRIQEAMGRYLQDPDLLQIDVIDPDNMIIAAKSPDRIGTVLTPADWLVPMQSRAELVHYTVDAAGQPILIIVEPLLDNDRIAAWVRIIFSLSQVRHEEVQAFRRMTVVTLALIAAGILGIGVAQRQASRVFRGMIAQLQATLATLTVSEGKERADAKAAGLPKPSRAYQGEFEYLTEVVSHITGLLKTQSEALRESELKFRSVAQSANDAIVSGDTNGCIIAWNHGAEIMFGYREEDVVGKPLTLLMPERYRERHAQGLKRLAATGESRIIGKTLELAGLRCDGSEFPLELSLATWKTGQGTFYTGIIRDITDRKRAEEALRALTASLEQKVAERTAELERARDQALIATRHKSEFLANMSHELRTPLNAVIGFSEVLIERMFGDVNEKQEEYLQDILSSGRHLLALINDILDLAKVESGRLELEISTFRLPATLENTVTLVRERARRHGIHVTLEIDERLDDFTADERKVKQVILNLLSNAIKFTPDGGAIALKASSRDERLEISVTDTGIGIAPEEHERIFGEFHQAGGAQARAREGTGLGLALAKKFVELHGGRIWVDSEVGRGSTFTFTLPFRSPREPRAADSVGTLAADHDRPLVLVVEDERAAAKLLSIYLVEAGFTVEVAEDGDVAFQKAEALRPAIITLDILIPKVEGWDLLVRLKANPQTAAIPVVIVSIVDERGKGFALGAADYLAKPVTRDELIGAIRRVTQRLQPAPHRIAVLAIDDDPMLLELTEAVLQPEGFAVLKATTGPEGVALARTARPDLVVLDLLMPGMDGFQVVDELKADPRTTDIPILVLTNKSLSPEDKNRLNGRISDLRHKSEFRRADFVAHLRSLLQSRSVCPKS